MAKEFVSANVTYHGGVSYSVGPHKFRKGFAETIMDEKLARELRAKPHFTVAILEKEVSIVEAVKTLKKKKKVTTRKKRSLKRKTEVK